MATFTNSKKSILNFENDMIQTSNFKQSWKCSFTLDDAKTYLKSIGVGCRMNPIDFVLDGFRAGHWKMEGNTLYTEYQLGVIIIHGKIEMELCDGIENLQDIFFNLITENKRLPYSTPPLKVEEPSTTRTLKKIRLNRDLVHPNRRRRTIKKGPQYLN